MRRPSSVTFQYAKISFLMAARPFVKKRTGLPLSSSLCFMRKFGPLRRGVRNGPEGIRLDVSYAVTWCEYIVKQLFLSLEGLY